MTIVGCYFDGAAAVPWSRLARTCAASAARHCAAWRLDWQRITPAPLLGSHETFVRNSQKLEYWIRAALALPDGTDVLLLDADTLILQSLDAIWQDAFDVAYTVKPAGSMFPFNGGVMFWRLSPATRVALTAWADRNRQMLAETRRSLRPGERREWRTAFGGINQASFADVLASPVMHGLTVRRLPCAEWNCEDESWASFDPDRTRILHIKGALRRQLFQVLPAAQRRPDLAPLEALWRAAERETHDRREGRA